MPVVSDGAGGLSAFLVNGQIRDARVLAAHRAFWITAQLHFAEPHAECVVGQESTDQRLTHPDQDLDRFRRLDHTDHAWEHAQDPSLASAGDETRRWGRWIEAAIARSLVWREDRGPALAL